MQLTREHWSAQDYNDFIGYLKTFSDEKYKKFSDALSPGSKLSYGVRVPVLRQIAKQIAKGGYAEFLECETGQYREEIMIKGLVMALIKCGYGDMLGYIKRYADMITGWETCDIVSFKGLKKYLPEFRKDVQYFICSENPWAVRFGLKILMEFYLTDEYIDDVLHYVNEIHSEHYYVKMMQAWLIATAAAKQRDKAFAFLARNELDAATQNMAVQKIRDSLRISDEDKALAASLRK